MQDAADLIAGLFDEMPFVGQVHAPLHGRAGQGGVAGSAQIEDGAQENGRRPGLDDPAFGQHGDVGQVNGADLA